MGMTWGCPWCGFGYGGFGWVFGLLWFALVAWLVYALVRGFTGGSAERPRDTDRALAILKERYARGEIDKDTFERVKRDLGG